MIVSKRKPNEKEGYTYSTIQIEEPKSFIDAQNSITIEEDTQVFSGKKRNYDAHPEIIDESKPAAKTEKVQTTVKKEAISSKTKVILVAYLAVAVILAAIVIATGIAVSNAQNRVSRLQSQVVGFESIAAGQESELYLFSDLDKVRGTAMNPDNQMEYVNEDEIIEIPLIKLTEPTEYKKSTNWFNEICEFFAKLFT